MERLAANCNLYGSGVKSATHRAAAAICASPSLPPLWPRPWHRPPTHLCCRTVQTSLAQFVELYEQSIDHSERAVLPAKRIANIIEHLT